jgi:hypothetical protein
VPADLAALVDLVCQEIPAVGADRSLAPDIEVALRLIRSDTVSDTGPPSFG